MRLSIKTIPTALAASAVLSLAVAGAAEAKVIRGTVVHTNHHAHSFTVAASHGKLTAIHASHSPAIGRRVAVKVRKLRNGTFAALRIHKLGVRGAPS